MRYCNDHYFTDDIQYVIVVVAHWHKCYLPPSIIRGSSLTIPTTFLLVWIMKVSYSNISGLLYMCVLVVRERLCV